MVIYPKKQKERNKTFECIELSVREAHSSWDGVGFVLAHALISHGTSLSLLYRCTHKANHHKTAWGA